MTIPSRDTIAQLAATIYGPSVRDADQPSFRGEKMSRAIEDAFVIWNTVDEVVTRDERDAAKAANPQATPSPDCKACGGSGRIASLGGPATPCPVCNVV